MFSEYYFYVAAFIEDPDLAEHVQGLHISPTVYRMDRIQDVTVLDETVRTPYANRFQEGERSLYDCSRSLRQRYRYVAAQSRRQGTSSFNNAKKTTRISWWFFFYEARSIVNQKVTPSVSLWTPYCCPWSLTRAATIPRPKPWPPKMRLTLRLRAVSTL